MAAGAANDHAACWQARRPRGQDPRRQRPRCLPAVKRPEAAAQSGGHGSRACAEARLDQAAFLAAFGALGHQPVALRQRPDRELLAIAVTTDLSNGSTLDATPPYPRSALAMSANPQTTIGRKWGQSKPSHGGQIRASFSPFARSVVRLLLTLSFSVATVLILSVA